MNHPNLAVFGGDDVLAHALGFGQRTLIVGILRFRKILPDHDARGSLHPLNTSAVNVLFVKNCVPFKKWVLHSEHPLDTSSHHH